jgi:hypothetical protein
MLARTSDAQRVGSYVNVGMRNSSSDLISTRTGRTEFSAARRVRNRRILSGRPMRVQFRCPFRWRVDKVRRPIRFSDDNDPAVESRIVSTTIAHICFGDVTSACDPIHPPAQARLA